MTLFCRHSRSLRSPFMSILLALITIVLTPQTGHTANLYTYTEINDPDATPQFGTSIYGINNASVLAGVYGYEDDAPYVFGLLYESGSYNSIAYPYFPPSTWDDQTELDGLNDSGDMVGFASWLYVGGGAANTAFTYNNGTVSDFSYPGATQTNLTGINNLGQIVGTYDNAFGFAGGFVYNNGGFTTIAYPGGGGFPEGINNLGQIVGTATINGAQGVFVYSNGVYTALNLPTNESCLAGGINDLGQVVGSCADSENYSHPFLYQNNTYYPDILPTQYSADGYEPYGINNDGQIAGTTVTETPGGFLATPINVPDAKTQGNPCNQPGSCGGGEPIDIATGNVFYQTTDYQTTGQNPLSFMRYYNSISAPTFALTAGMNWRSNYDRYIRILSASSVIVERQDGRQLSFTLSGSTWSPDSDVDLHLTNSGSTWTLTDSTDTVETYTTQSGGFEAILNTITSRNGYTQTLHYNGSSQLTSVSDSYSRSLGFTYNNGLIQTVTTPDSLVLTYGYTTITQGTQLTSVSFNTSPVSSVTYNYGQNSAPFSALTSIIDEDNNTYATWTYDIYSRGLTSQLGGGANLITMTYNSDGTTTVKNALGVRDIYSFSTLQGVPKITQIARQATSTTAAATRTFGYDGNGYLNSATDWDGNLTTYTNDGRGQPTVINEAVGSSVARTTDVTYDTTTPNTIYPYHLPTVMVTPGLTTNFTYDASGNLRLKTLMDTTSQSVPYSTNGQTRTWHYTYSNFLLASVRTPRTDVTNKTSFTYDSSGALTEISNALSQNTNITAHTGGGLPLTVVDPNGITTALTYNNRNHLLTSTVMTSGGNFETMYGYDPAQNLTSVTLPDGSELTNGYDTAHRLTSVTDLFGNYIEYTLDALGDRTLIDTYDSTDTLQRTHSGMFDALGRITQDIGGEGQTTKFTYDPNSNTLHITDPLSHQTQQAYDALNRLSTVTDPTPGGTTTTTYDAHDRPLSVEAQNGATTDYVYDGFGDMIQQASPDSGTSVYYYDPDSDLTQKIDATGATTNNTYDALDRVKTTAYPSDATENVAYTYDQTTGHGYGVGRLTSLTDAAGSLSRTYNARGDIAKETRTISGNTLPTTYTFDAANRIATITYPSGTVVTYIRDIMGRITSVTSKAPGAGSAVNVATSIGYEPFGPVAVMTFGNSVADARTYDLDYRLDTLIDAATAGDLQNLTYGYDAANNVQTITNAVTSGNSQSMGYDTHNRLKSAAGNYGSLAYTYDYSDNRTYQTVAPASTYTYTPDSNVLDSVKTSGVTQTIGITAAGNINSFSPALPSGITSLTYNQANRLATASASGTQVAAYTYDAFGHRLEKVTSATTLFQYDQGGHLLEELNGSGAAQADYLYLGDMPLATLTPSTGALYFLHDDTLGTPQLASNSTQSVAWSTTYQPFGATATITGSLIQNIRLPGQYADAETGFSQNWFRDYVSILGRYLEPDPIGLNGGINTYGYAYQNPLMYTDPLGLWPFGAPTSGFNFGSVHVPSKSTVTTQLQQALNQGGTCQSLTQAQQIANDIVNQVGWSDLGLAQAILNSLQNGTPLTGPQLTAAQQFINNLPSADQPPLNQLLKNVNGGAQ